MRPLGIVGDEVIIEVFLHFRDFVIPFLPSFDSEVFTGHGPVESLKEAVALGAPDFGGSVFDAFELEEEFVRMAVWA